MSDFTRFITMAIAIIFAENLFFSRALGTEVVIRIMARPRDFLKFSLILTIVTVLSSVTGWMIDFAITALGFTVYASYYVGKSLAYVIALILMYLLADAILHRAAPAFHRSISKVLPIAVFNTAALGAPLLLTRLRPTLLTGLPGSNLLGAVIFGVAVGVGFMFALLLMTEGIRQIEAMDLPDAFDGLPARFVYIGLLALAFAGVAGRQTLL
ncbi:MAG TPA: Rnf-Nqr domain containing protein [Oscillospiraceae bacterium]|nr:Rnf-Nqr domain containing protein [Oscillospiraceae bacterium]HPF56088.1 Rnf-Nqr domain containing protein [Clostridiales bacterium]HPK36206.1 Rnf-Nqr domain containing protein [Oscillospiraceae bacterium]HPR75697.1 Rnf-Nqr domain containing protein [Oscillospiraceae bacterium]